MTKTMAMFLCAILLVPGKAAAGDSGAVLESQLAQLDPGPPPSGVLYDRVLGLADLAELDGSADAPVIGTSRWRQAVDEIRRAADDPGDLPGPAEWRKSRRSDRVRIGVIDYRVDRLVEGRNGIAMEEVRVFAAAALRERTFRGAAVRFEFDPERWFTNRRRPVVELRFDPDDGSGERIVRRGDTVLVNYATEGTRTPVLRARTADGEWLRAAFRFEVAALVTPSPQDTIPLTASNSWEGSPSSGDAWVYLADGHSTLTRPVAVVEGFDLDDSLYWDEIYALLNAENLLEEVRAAGYDLVVLNFDSATTHIQRNSLLVVELIEEIQSRIDPRARFTVAGASMGALCSRYALAWMEQNGVEHRVNTWISFDGPHRGANIPLGLQYWLQFFAGESADAAFLLSRLDRPAARQLLACHYTTPPSPTGTADPLRTAFEADLAALGGYPAQPRRVAIANGSGAGQDQGYGPGAQLLRWEYDSFLVDIRGNVWAQGDGAPVRIFQGEIDPFLLPATTSDVTVTSAEPWDSAPGGSRASLLQADQTAAPYGDIVALHPSHCFIPTVSALDVPTADLFFDLDGTADLAGLTPFDAVYFPAENQDHVLVTAENKVWFQQELYASPTALAATPAPGVRLHPNLPNPFNPSTRISFEIDLPARVRLEVFDARGARVARILDRALPAGRVDVGWDGTDDGGRRVASGVYHCRLEAAGQVLSRPMVLLK